MKKLCAFLALFVFVGVSLLQAQTVQITGTVSSAEEGNLPGVSIIVKGTTVGTTTDGTGMYSINVPANASALTFSFMGYKTQDVAIAGRKVIDVVLEIDALALEEIVVTGYGFQRKREVTGSIAQVKGDKIASLATPSFESQLAGRATGVQVSTPSGIIGQAPVIRIRGTNSITSGTYPLIVVDGIPIFTGNIGSVLSSNALGDINPSDIESIEILKDGAATAIYGSRAANGVILITTKKGTQGQFNVTYNNYVGIAQVSNRIDLLNPDQFVTIQNEKYTNAAGVGPASNTGTAGDAVTTDWWDIVFRTGVQQDHSISVSGANEKTSYYTSFGYTSQEGTSINNSMNRFSIRTNIQQKATNWLTIGANAAVTRSSYDGLNTGPNSLSGNVFSVIRQHPNVPVMNPLHPTGYNIDFTNADVVGRWNNTSTIGDNITNIKFVLDKNKHKQISNRFIGLAFGEVKFMEGLVFKTQFGVDAAQGDGFIYWDPRHGDGKGYAGYMYQVSEPSTRWNQQNILSYNKTFAEIHSISATLVAEFQMQEDKFFSSTAQGISDGFFNENIISGTFTTPNVGGGKTERSFVSYAGRLNYNYADKYFAQFSIRQDAISSLPKENRVGIFPGGSIGWALSEESFIKDNISFISDLKIKVSYAEVGNVDIGNYPYWGIYGAGKYGTQNGVAFSQIGNQKLQWESSKKFGTGFDLAVFDGKYKLSVDYFKNDIDNLILAAPIAPSLGVPGNSINKNIGSVKNSGIELAAEANLIKTKDFGLSVDANITLSQNEVVSLVDGQTEILGVYNIVRIGESMNALYGFDYVGVNTTNGNPIYRKADGTLIQGNIANQTYYVYDAASPAVVVGTTPTSTLAATDKVVLGNSVPTYYGSFGLRANYKNFDFGVMFRYSGGNYLMNRTRQDLLGQSFTNNGTEILGRWVSATETGDGVTPMLWSGRGNFINTESQTNSRFVEKADYVKLANVQLGYTLPQNVVKFMGASNLRVFVQGQNLLTFTKYTGLDPELQGTITGTNSVGVDHNVNPISRIYTFGLSLKF